jgi:hypothetical protein
MAAALYGARRERIAVRTASGALNIRETYKDVVEFDAEGHKFRCLVCSALFDILDGNEKEAPWLNVDSSFNIPSHLARCCPHELVQEHRGKLAAPASARAEKLLKDRGERRPISSFFTAAPPRATLSSYDQLYNMTRYIVVGGHSFRSVESGAFADMLKGLAPGVILPSADTIARNVLLTGEVLKSVFSRRILPGILGHSTFDDVFSELAHDKPGIAVSITTDAWTGIDGNSYIAVTLHYIDADFVAHAHVIALRIFPPPHTADAYLDMLDRILAEYGLSDRAVFVITSDGAATMVKFVSMTQSVHQRCVAHGMHLAVKGKRVGLSTVLAPVNKLAITFNNISTLRNHVAAAKAAELGVSLRKAITPVVTRWGSDLNALLRHIDRWPVVSRLDARELFKLSSEIRAFTDLLATCEASLGLHKAIADLLKTAASWTVQLQSAGPTMALLFTMRDEITKALLPMGHAAAAADDDKEEEARIRDALRHAFEARLCGSTVPVGCPTVREITSSPTLSKTAKHWFIVRGAELLDVRTFARWRDDVRLLHDVFVECAARVYMELLELTAARVPVVEHRDLDPADMVLLASAAKSARQFPLEPIKSKLYAELVIYKKLAAAANPNTTDPLAFWRTNAPVLPYYAVIVRSIMSAQAASSASERVFSTAGWLQNPLRNRLSPNTLEQLTLLMSAFKNNIDLRKDVAELLEARKKRANEKRSAAAALANAAKKHAAAPAAAAAAGSDAAAENAVPIIVDGDAPADLDDDDVDDDNDAVFEDWAQATPVELPPVPAVNDERATYQCDDDTCITMLFTEHSADAS